MPGSRHSHYLYADPKAIQQINFTRNIAKDEDRTRFLITEEAKEIVSDFLQRTVRVL